MGASAGSAVLMLPRMRQPSRNDDDCSRRRLVDDVSTVTMMKGSSDSTVQLYWAASDAAMSWAKLVVNDAGRTVPLNVMDTRMDTVPVGRPAGAGTPDEDEEAAAAVGRADEDDDESPVDDAVTVVLD